MKISNQKYVIRNQKYVIRDLKHVIRKPKIRISTSFFHKNNTIYINTIYIQYIYFYYILKISEKTAVVVFISRSHY